MRNHGKRGGGGSGRSDPNTQRTRGPWGTTEAKAGSLSPLITEGVVDAPQSYL